MKNDYPDDEEIERTSKIIQTLNIKNGAKLTQLYLKSDVILLADVFEKFNRGLIWSIWNKSFILC